MRTGRLTQCEGAAQRVYQLHRRVRNAGVGAVRFFAGSLSDRIKRLFIPLKRVFRHFIGIKSLFSIYPSGVMLSCRALANVLVDFVLESHDGLGGTVEASIWGDPIMLLKSSNSLTIHR